LNNKPRADGQMKRLVIVIYVNLLRKCKKIWWPWRCLCM